MDTVGERIKIIRKNRKINQVDFAKSLGISQTHVSKIEKNVENPSKTLLMFISHRYRVNLEWIEIGKGEIDLNYDFETEGCINQINTMVYQLEQVVKNLGQHDSGTVVYCLKAFNRAILGPISVYCAQNDAKISDFFNYKNESSELYSTYLDTLEKFSNNIQYFTRKLSESLVDNDVDNVNFNYFNRHSSEDKKNISRSMDHMIITNFENKYEKMN